MNWKDARSIHTIVDKDRRVRGYYHTSRAFVVSERSEGDQARFVAEQYLAELADVYDLTPELLQGNGLKPAAEPDLTSVQLRFEQERRSGDLILVTYIQTLAGIPIWRAGLCVTIRAADMAVISSRSNIHYDIGAAAPLHDIAARQLDAEDIRSLLGYGPEVKVSIRSTLRCVYRYSASDQFRQNGDQAIWERHQKPIVIRSTSLPQEGNHYFANNVVFAVEAANVPRLTCRVLVDVTTETILMFEAFISGATGKVFLRDPYRNGAPYDGLGKVTPLSNNSTLTALTTQVTLEGLESPRALKDPPFTEYQYLGGRDRDGADAGIDNRNVRLLDETGSLANPPSKPAPSYDFFLRQETT